MHKSVKHEVVIFLVCEIILVNAKFRVVTGIIFF